MAEGEGFEPPNELPRCRFSRPVLSTTQPPLLRRRNLPFFSNLYNNKKSFFCRNCRKLPKSYNFVLAVLEQKAKYKFYLFFPYNDCTRLTYTHSLIIRLYTLIRLSLTIMGKSAIMTYSIKLQNRVAETKPKKERQMNNTTKTNGWYFLECVEDIKNHIICVKY